MIRKIKSWTYNLLEAEYEEGSKKSFLFFQEKGERGGT